MIMFLLVNFSNWRLLIGFHWSNSKSTQVSRTLLSILAYLNNAVVWMVSAHSQISNSSSPLHKPLWTIPCASVTIVITFKFMFFGFLGSLARSKYLFCFSFSLILTLWSAGNFEVQTDHQIQARKPEKNVI